MSFQFLCGHIRRQPSDVYPTFILFVSWFVFAFSFLFDSSIISTFLNFIFNCNIIVVCICIIFILVLPILTILLQNCHFLTICNELAFLLRNIQTRLQYRLWASISKNECKMQHTLLSSSSSGMNTICSAPTEVVMLELVVAALAFSSSASSLFTISRSSVTSDKGFHWPISWENTRVKPSIVPSRILCNTSLNVCRYSNMRSKKR